MKDFKYCIWLTTQDYYKWDNLTNGFKSHITLYKELEFTNALEKYDNIEPELFHIYLNTSLKAGSDCDFNFIYSDVNVFPSHKLINKDSHISFHYEYDYKIDNNLLNLYNKKVKDFNYGKFDTIMLVNCYGHFKNWKIIAKKTIKEKNDKYFSKLYKFYSYVLNCLSKFHNP